MFSMHYGYILDHEYGIKKDDHEIGNTMLNHENMVVSITLALHSSWAAI